MPSQGHVPPQQQDAPQRIPVPQPTQQEQAQEREARKAEAKRLHEEHVRESTVPSWGGEVRRVLGYSVAAVILACILILAVRWRLLVNNSYETVENTDTWTSIVAMLMPFMFPFLILEMKRPDLGFRLGTIPFLPQAALLATVVQWIGMLVWPWLVGRDLGIFTVLATLGSDPISFVSAAACIATATNLFLLLTTAMVTCFMTMRWVVGLIILVPWLTALLGFGYLNVKTFNEPPSTVVCLTWVAAAVVSFVLLIGVDLLRNVLHRRAQRTESARRGPDEYRPSLEELGWNPR
jgi:hypothetical protein